MNSVRISMVKPFKLYTMDEPQIRQLHQYGQCDKQKMDYEYHCCKEHELLSTVLNALQIKTNLLKPINICIFTCLGIK